MADDEDNNVDNWNHLLAFDVMLAVASNRSCHQIKITMIDTNGKESSNT